MSAHVKVTPNPARRGALVDVDSWCLDTKPKYDVVTVDQGGYVSGAGSNGTRPLTDGSFRRGIVLPTSGSKCKVQVRQGKVVVASVDVGLTA